MTESEARLILDVRISRFDHAGDVNKALEIAKQALKEVQQYREIGTVEECREAMEKQKSKSPAIEGDGYDEDGEMIYDTWICPSCGKDYEIDCDDYDFCPNCGQRILH